MQIKTIRFISLVLCVILMLLCIGCVKKDKDELNVLSEVEAREKLQKSINVATCKDIFEQFIKYHAEVDKLNKRCVVTVEMVYESISKREINENILSYISEYRKISTEFKKNLEKMEIDDEKLQDLRYYLIRHVDYMNDGNALLEKAVYTLNVSHATNMQTYALNSMDYYKKALKIFEEELNVETEDYSWSV